MTQVAPAASPHALRRDIDAVNTDPEEEINDTIDTVASHGCGNSIHEHEYNEKTCSHSARDPNRLQRDFCHDKVGALSYGMQRANTKTVDEDVRMELNGETQAMMDHVQKKWEEKC